MQNSTNISSTFSEYCTGYYGFGFNGQEKDQEIYNNQSTTTATFWEYDGRIGRRWNLDPVVKEWESGYATFINSPILFSDPDGLDPSGSHSIGDGKNNGTRGRKQRLIKRDNPEQPSGDSWKTSTSINYKFTDFFNQFRTHKKHHLVPAGYYSSSGWMGASPTESNSSGSKQTFRLSGGVGDGVFRLRGLRIVDNSQNPFGVYIVTGGPEIPTGGEGDQIAEVAAYFNNVDKGNRPPVTISASPLIPLANIISTISTLSNFTDADPLDFLKAYGFDKLNSAICRPTLKKVRDFHVYCLVPGQVSYNLQYKYRQHNIYSTSNRRNALQRWFYGTRD